MALLFFRFADEADGTLNPTYFEPVTSSMFTFNPLEVVSGLVLPTVLAGDDGVMAQVAPMSSTDHYGAVQFNPVNAGASGGPGVRVTAADGTGYFFSVSFGSPGAWLLYKYTPDYTELDSGTTTVSHISKVLLRVDGTTLRGYVDGGLVVTAVDSDLSSGTAGFVAYATSAVTDVQIFSFWSDTIPATVTWDVEQAFTEDNNYVIPSANCYFQTFPLLCLNDGFRAVRWEGQRPTPVTDLVDSHVRIFTTSDDGATWSLQNEFDVPPLTQWNTVYSPDGIRLLAAVSDKGGYAYDSSYSGLAYSDDGGLTWTSSISSSVFSGIGSIRFSAQSFTRLPGTDTIIAAGHYDVSSVLYALLISTDLGATFSLYTEDNGSFFGLTYIVALSATQLYAEDGNTGYYSSDAGVTWTASTVTTNALFPSTGSAATYPGENSSSQPFVHLGDGVILRSTRDANPQSLGQPVQASLWISTDYGHTFGLLSYIYGDSAGVMANRPVLRPLSDQTVLLGTNNGSSANWWITTNRGVSWAEATLVDTMPSISLNGPLQTSITITSAGTMLASLEHPTSPISTAAAVAQVWRSNITALVDEWFPTCISGENIFAGTWVDTQMVPVFA